MEAGGVWVVLARVHVAQRAPERVAEFARALLHALMRTVQIAATIVGRKPHQHGIEMAIEGVAIEAGQAVLMRPLLAHPLRRAYAILPVDLRSAAERRTSSQLHAALDGRVVAATPVEVP